MILMKKYLFTWMAVFLLSGNASANLLTNGSFENGDFGDNDSWKRVIAGDSSITGWISGGAGVDWHNQVEMSPQPDGLLVVDLNPDGDAANNTGTISQAFATTPGSWYQLSFWLAGPRPNPEDTEFTDPRSVKVDIGDLETTFSQPASDNLNLVWGEKILEFQATGTSTTLMFSSVNGNGYWGPVLDNVSVNLVPVPTTVWLFGSGLMGLLGVRRKLSGFVTIHHGRRNEPVRGREFLRHFPVHPF